MKLDIHCALQGISASAAVAFWFSLVVLHCRVSLCNNFKRSRALSYFRVCFIIFASCCCCSCPSPLPPPPYLSLFFSRCLSVCLFLPVSSCLSIFAFVELFSLRCSSLVCGILHFCGSQTQIKSNARSHSPSAPSPNAVVSYFTWVFPPYPFPLPLLLAFPCYFCHYQNRQSHNSNRHSRSQSRNQRQTRRGQNQPACLRVCVCQRGNKMHKNQQN